MTTIRLRVYGHPAPQGSKTIIRGSLVETSKRLPAWRKAITEAAKYDLTMRRNPQPLNGPLETTITFYMPRPRKHYRTGTHTNELRTDAPTWCTNTPDKDKLERGVNDALTLAGIWNEDAQIVRSHTTKLWSHNTFTGAVITITQLEQGNPT